jgi:hypothetical protein
VTSGFCTVQLCIQVLLSWNGELKHTAVIRGVHSIVLCTSIIVLECRAKNMSGTNDVYTFQLFV